MTLLSKESIEDYREMAASTIEECDKLIGIINTMLEITETEAGMNSIEIQPVDIVALIVSACDLFEPVAQEKEVQITKALPEELIIDSNKHMLQRLVSNLLENAIKYNRPGGSVAISAEKKGQRVDIKFSDTGIGITEEDIPKIFERFYRCETVRSETGTGLGLSLASAMALALNGDIRVKSVLNKGSSFSVSLPA
jgi:signal transduction histidine kinase